MLGDLKFLKGLVLFMGISLIAGVSMLFYLVFTEKKISSPYSADDLFINSDATFNSISFYKNDAFIVTNDTIFVVDLKNDKVLKSIHRK